MFINKNNKNNKNNEIIKIKGRVKKQFCIVNKTVVVLQGNVICLGTLMFQSNNANKNKSF